jgi:hypothetical protein
LGPGDWFRERFDEFIACLTAHGVEFVIVGAYALAYQIHVMSTISGVTWAEIWAHRVDGPFGSRIASYIGRDTFIRNKRAAARPKDLSDIDALERGQES